MTIQDKLREQLHKLFPDAKDCGNKKEISINCPLCNREGNIDRGHHMYISLGYDNKPPMYNCFRNMNHRGILTESVLKEFSNQSQYLDTALLEEIDNYNKKVTTFNRNRLNNYTSRRLKFDCVENTENNLYKLNYINKRLGLNLSYNDIIRNKIILNFKDFLMCNDIYESNTFNQYNRNNIDLFSEYFIGFCTSNNSSIIFRNVLEGIDDKDKLPKLLQYRYTKYSLYNNDNDRNYYILPTVCNTLNHIDICIAEGPFDILSVFYNVYNQDIGNKIYCSIGGNNYFNALYYFTGIMGLIDATFHIYIDNDISQTFIDKLRSFTRSILADMYIYMNNTRGEKDFGVPLDKINIFSYKL